MSKVIMRKDKPGTFKERTLEDDFNDYCDKKVQFIHSPVSAIFGTYRSGFDR